MSFETGITVLRMIGRPCGASLYEIATALDISYTKARNIMNALNKEFEISILDAQAINPRYERYFLGFNDNLGSQLLRFSYPKAEDYDFYA